MFEQPQRTDILSYIRTIGTQFVIPVYQRNYTWDHKKEVKQMLDDFSNLINEDKTHFLGIIMYLSKTISYNFRENVIIDGQQRLTTFFLLLNAIREIAVENEMEQIVINVDEIINNKGVTDSQKMKLKPLISDDDAYNMIATGRYDLLNSENSKERYSNSRVYINYKFIKNYLIELFQKFGYDDVLNTLNKLIVVVIPIAADDNAQQVFESINAAGVPLAHTDLIRNYILMDLSTAHQDIIYKDYWTKIEGIFNGSKKIEDFFRAYLSVKNYSLCNKKEIYSEFKKHWNDTHISVEDKLSDIFNYATHFEYLYLKENTNNIPLPIIENRMLNLLTPATLLLEILELKRINMISEADVCSIIETVNIYFIRRDLASCENNVTSRLFPSLLKKVKDYCDGDYTNVVEVVKMFLINYNMNNKSFMPDDKKIEINLKNINSYSKPNLEMILQKIENIDNTTMIAYNTLSKEHIMPQTPTKYWREVSGDLSDEEYSRYVNLLGNLTLVSSVDNSSMGNKNFEVKKEHLKRSKHIKLNGDILLCNQWDTNKIDERTEKLIKLINKVYPYSKSNLPMKKKLGIYLSKNSIEISGFLNEDLSVIIEVDSIFKHKRVNSNLSSSLISTLCLEGILEEQNGKYTFVKEHRFNSIDDASSLIIPDIIDPIEYWVDDSGVTIKELFQHFDVQFHI